MAPITCEARVKQLNQEGGTVLSHLKIEDIERANATGANPLGVYINDGYYRLIQMQDDNAVANATINMGSDAVGRTEFPVVMDSSSKVQILDRFWRMTRQYGVKNAFTIVPVITPTGGVQDPKLGGTAADKDNAVWVKRSGCFPVWRCECEEQVTYRNKDGTINTISYFRIYDPEGQRAWNTDNKSCVTLANVPNGRPPANQLFELVQGVKENTASIQRIQDVTVTATDAKAVKKYYMGTKITHDNLLRYLSIQCRTDARDQGWASNPNQGMWSWFELAIFEKEPQSGQNVEPNQIKAGPNGHPLTWTSHSTKLSSQYIEQDGPAFERDHPIWKHVKDGDYVGMMACAQFPMWKCDARRGELRIRELVVNNKEV